MDNGTGMFTIYNLPRYRDNGLSPASTFKIVNAPIGLQTGIVISSDSMVIEWDGVQRPIEAWNVIEYGAGFQGFGTPIFRK